MTDITVAMAQLGLPVLAGDFIGEVIRFIMYLAIIVCAFAIGFNLRKHNDARKAAQADEHNDEASQTDAVQ